MHEIGHGLLAVREIADFTERVADFGTGMMSGRVVTRATASGLRLAQESIIDTLTLEVSDLDKDAYLGGKFPDVGYCEEDKALSRLTLKQPDLSAQMWQAMFSTGIRDKQQALLFAEAFQSEMDNSTLDQ